MKSLKSSLPVILVVICLAIPVGAQTTFGSITGSVSDPTGAMMPNVRVTATNLNTQFQRQVRTTNAGVFNVPNLDVATYRIRVEAPGFAVFERGGLILNSNQVINVDVHLLLATTTATAEVSAPAPVIDTETSTIANVKTARDLEQLPMIARQKGDEGVYAFTALNPGVNAPSNSGGVPVVQGVRMTTGTLATMDGISSMQSTIGEGGPEVQGIEGVQELNVQHGNPQAEFRTAAVFTIVSKSGTNQYHGSAFWVYNGNTLNARTFFNPAVPFRVYHNFGGSIGGPIRKDKTFFFADYEGSRESAENLLIATTPLPAWRNGDFSGVSTAIIDPQTGQRFPGNIIPASRINPVSQKAENFLYPLPNFGPPGLLASNFRSQFPGHSSFDDWDHFDIRVDHNFTPHDLLFGRVSYRRMPNFSTSDLPSIGYTPQVYEGRSATISYTHIFTPTLLNELRLGGSYIRNKYEPAIIGSDLLKQFGIQGIPLVGLHNVPIFDINGITSADIDAAGESHQDLINTSYEVIDNLSWTHGAHFMKFGFNAIRDYLGGSNWSSNIYGQFAFNGVYTGLGFADFLLGIPQTTTVSVPTPTRYIRGTLWSMYAQDQFKVNSRLTLNYGLRWELSGPYYDKNGNLYNFDPRNGALVVPNHALPNINPAFPTNIPIETASQAGFPDNTLENWDKKTFYPRVGFAYKPFAGDNTVVRAGYGIYDNIIYSELARHLAGGPFSGAVTYVNAITNGTPLFSFPLPVLNSGTTATQNVMGTNPNAKVPYTQQWNFTLERQISSVGVRVSYVGTHSVGLLYRRNLNQPQPSTAPFSINERPYPLYNQVIWVENGGFERYNGLEVAVIKNYGKNLTFTSGWTWGKDLTDDQDTTNIYGPLIQNQFNLVAEKANSSFVVRHRLFGYAVYALPFGKSQRFLNHGNAILQALVGNWSTAWNAVFQTGPYFTPSFSGFDPSNTQTFGGRPDVVAGASVTPPGGSNINGWFNPGAFAVPGCPATNPVCSNPANIGRFGNAGVNILQGPGISNLDFSLARYFAFTEHKRLQFRANFTDVFNHPNFGFPAANISAPNTVGTITSVVNAQLGGRSSREIDLMLRFEF